MLVFTLAAFFALAAYGSATGFAHKAVVDERAASTLAGGFDTEQRRAYHDGLVYLQSLHAPIGRFTIAQVIGEGRVHRTPAASSANDASLRSAPIWAVVLGIVIVTAVLSFARKAAPQAKIAEATSRQAATQAEIAEATSRPLLPIDSVGIVPHKDERFYLRCSGTQVIAERHHAHYVGGYSGLSFRVARGVYARTGGSHGRRVDRVTVDVDDTGSLYASNQRIVFVGSRRTIDVPLSRVVAIDVYTDGFKISRSNASAVVIRTGDQTSAIVLRRIVARDVVNPTVAERQNLEQRAALLERANEVFADAQKQHADGSLSDADFQKASEMIERVRSSAHSSTRDQPGA